MSIEVCYDVFGYFAFKNLKKNYKINIYDGFTTHLESGVQDIFHFLVVFFYEVYFKNRLEQEKWVET